MLEAFKDNPASWGWGLMHEPDRKAGWPARAQTAIEAIRTVDPKARRSWPRTRSASQPAPGMVTRRQ